MSTAFKVLACLVLVILSLVLLLQIDDDLNSETQAMHERVDWQTHTDSYPYFMGISTKLGSDPLRVGNDILVELRDLESNYLNVVSYEDAPSLRDRDTLQLGDQRHFCSLRDDETCLLSLFTQVELRSFSPEMLELKKRFTHFLEMNDFRTLSKPHIFEPFGPYSALTQGNRLVSLEAIELARKGKAELAAQKLYSHLERQRNFSSNVDSLIARMVAYVLMNETIEILYLVIKENDLKGVEIDALSPNELSLKKIVSREFVYVSSALDIARYDVRYSAWPVWMLRILVKPNMTMNASSENYIRAIRVSEEERPNFELQNFSPKASRIRNPIGNVMSQAGVIGFDEYIARGFNLNVKIALFNATLNREISAESLAKISNPYDPQEFDAELSEDKQFVCMGGPLEDRKGYRCLPLALSSS